MRPNGFAGRELLGLLKNNNYEDVVVEVIPFVIRDFSQTPFSDWLTTESLKNKIATQKEIDRWNQELMDKTTKGTFLPYVNIIMVAGRKR